MAGNYEGDKGDVQLVWRCLETERLPSEQRGLTQDLTGKDGSRKCVKPVEGGCTSKHLPHVARIRYSAHTTPADKGNPIIAPFPCLVPRIQPKRELRLTEPLVAPLGG